MRGTFNGSQSPYVYDHRQEAFYRAQDEERRLTERVERASHWLASRMVGLTFSSLDELRAVCMDVCATLYGGRVDDETATVITRAANHLWLGQVTRSLLFTAPVRATVTEQPHTVTFAQVA